MLHIDYLKNYIALKPLFLALKNGERLHYAKAGFRSALGMSKDDARKDDVLYSEYVSAAPFPSLDGKPFLYIALTPPPVNHNGDICGKVRQGGKENVCIGSLEGYLWTQAPTTYSTAALCRLPRHLFEGDPTRCQFNENETQKFVTACEFVLTASVKNFNELFELAKTRNIDLKILF